MDKTETFEIRTEKGKKENGKNSILMKKTKRDISIQNYMVISQNIWEDVSMRDFM